MEYTAVYKQILKRKGIW